MLKGRVTGGGGGGELWTDGGTYLYPTGGEDISVGGTHAATAHLHMAAGSTTAGTAPAKFISGPVLTSPEPGAAEFLTDAYYVTTTTGSTRRMLVAGTTGRAVNQDAVVASVATYTLGATDASFEVSANINVTQIAPHELPELEAQCTYTDEGNTARTVIMAFTIVNGNRVTSIHSLIASATAWTGLTIHLRCKASTAITVKTVQLQSFLFLYNVEAVIRQIA